MRRAAELGAGGEVGALAGEVGLAERVIQAGHRLHLVAERGAERRFAGAFGGHHLHRHPLSRVDAAPHLGHAAAADAAIEPEGTQRDRGTAAHPVSRQPRGLDGSIEGK
jgi:hypothetical protein